MRFGRRKGALEEALDGVEGPLDGGEVLVGLDGGVDADGLAGEAGADDVGAVELGFGGDAVVAAGPGELVVGDVDVEMAERGVLMMRDTVRSGVSFGVNFFSPAAPSAQPG